MPRLRLAWPAGPARRLPALALAAAALALPPPVLHAALASAAGTVFEAAPFVLAGTLLRSERLRRLAGFVSCGCGSLSGALALPALALCWLGFGPAVALARFGAAAAVFGLLRRRRRGSPLEPSPDPLSELTSLALAACVAALASEALRAWGPGGGSGAVRAALLFLAGAAAGALGPCASAAVATASGLRGAAPAAAAGLLATAGIFQPLRLSSHDACGRPERAATMDYGLLGLACGWLVLGGSGGFVHPRLLPAIAVASALCCFLALRAGSALRTRAPLAVPLGLLAALALGSPLPDERIDGTNLGDAFPGAKLVFSGTAQTRGAHTLLVRYAITCCRADASPVALVLAHPLPVRDGTWVEAGGTLERAADGELVLAAATWRATAAPRDRFVYR